MLTLPDACWHRGSYATLTNAPTKTVDRWVFFHTLQLPQGALPLAGSTATSSTSINLAPYASRQLTSTFYFPQPGLFKRVPVSVTKQGRWERL